MLDTATHTTGTADNAIAALRSVRYHCTSAGVRLAACASPCKAHDGAVKLFQRWGKQLAAAQRGATIIPLKTKAA